MAEEYRIDISLGATDTTGPAFQSASKRVSAFEKSMQRTEKQLNRMDRSRWQLTVHAIDRASSVITGINRRALSLTGRAFTITLRAADYATKPIRAVGSLLTSTLGLLGAAGGTWAGVVYPLQLAGELEQTQMAFEKMLGDAQKARQFLSDATQFAWNTPFERNDILENSRLLMAYGFQAEQILPMLRSIGDAAAGSGKGAAAMNSIIMAIGQMYAKGKPQYEELMQLQEAGINTTKILGEELGLTAEQVANIADSGINSATVIDALLRGIDKKFGGTMDRQSRSLLGMLSNLKEVFSTKLLERWGTGLQLGLQPHLERLADWFDENQATVERWGNTLQDAGTRAAEWLMGKFGTAVEWVQDLINSPEWAEADGFFEHLQVAWDKFWSEGGEEWARQVGATLGRTLKEGIQSGFGTLSDVFWSVQGTTGGTLLDLWLLGQAWPILSALGGLAGGLFRGGAKAWQWFRGIRGGAAAAGALGTGAAVASGSSAAAAQAATAAAAASTAGKVVQILGPNKQVLSTVVQNADDLARVAGTGSKALGVLGRFGGALSKVGRFAGPVGAILGTGLGLLGLGSADDKGKVIGGAVGGGFGGWGGAVGGAAIGSMIAPGIGTVVGGILGGLAGGFGGDWLGSKIGDWFTPDKEPAPVPTTASASAGTVVVNVTANPTYRIETAADAEGVLRVIQSHQRSIADTLADEIADALEDVFGNMARSVAPRKAWGVTPP